MAKIMIVFRRKTIKDSTPKMYRFKKKPYIDHVNAAIICNRMEYEWRSSVECKWRTFHTWGILDIIDKTAPIDARNKGRSM
tara:strand:- start:3425 stop:3667 length:243 start_codon:yes stop_codon:yes gene_type:complete